jgi:hypothetical protein
LQRIDATRALFSPVGRKSALDQISRADFDSAIPRFESWRPSQILSDKIKDIETNEQRAGAIFMLRRVAKISKHFQGSPICAGDSTQHERNMEARLRVPVYFDSE